MKIIKVGKLAPNKIIKVCSKCETEFEYLQSDVKVDKDGRYVNCPVCGAFIGAK